MLAAQVRQLEQLLMEAHVSLALLQADVTSVAARIGTELEKATMGRRDLLEQVQMRLQFAVQTSQEQV
jgi:hypothetical protein